MANQTIISNIRQQANTPECQNIEQEGATFLREFQASFSPQQLKSLSGQGLLTQMFINDTNKTGNLSYYLEKASYKMFGAIGGAPECFFLYYSNSKADSTPGKKWRSSDGARGQVISEQEAIVKGEAIRDKLVLGADVIGSFGPVKSEQDCISLAASLYAKLGAFGYKNWVLKYYALIFPDIFANYYSDKWLTGVLDYLGETQINTGSEADKIANSLKIRKIIKDELSISNQVFGHLVNSVLSPSIKPPKSTSVNNNNQTGVVNTNAASGVSNVTANMPKRKFALNRILYGAPGTGKTYNSVDYALAVIEDWDIDGTGTVIQTQGMSRKDVMNKFNAHLTSGQIAFATFHQSYGYEDFIQGLRPAVNAHALTFIKQDGVFKKISDEAAKPENSEKKYVMIIDEINRANISRVLGELITLIEDDKRKGEENAMEVTLPSGDRFSVPNNLYIIGTMNSADKSISLIDTALRRRFEFVEFVPNPDLIADSAMKDVFVKLNDELQKELKSTDCLIGHAYFIGRTAAELKDIMNLKIIPLLYEYFYDDGLKVKRLIEDALSVVPGLNLQVSDGNGLGRAKVI